MVTLKLFEKKNKIKALIAFPNKQIEIINVDFTNERFSHKEKTYLVDENAVYFWKKTPFLIYRWDTPSPMRIGTEGPQPTMTSGEIQSAIESKAVRDLLTASAGDMGWTFYAAAASAAIGLALLLIEFGVIKVGQ